MEQIIVYAFPVFSLLILAEYAYGLTTGHNTYRINDAISSLSQGLLSQITVVFTQVFTIGIYTLVFKEVALFHPGFWNAWYGWLAALVLYDFFDYWYHRYSHETAILWAAHVVHHQSQNFNFSTALRQESAYPLLGWIFYLPMAILGVPPDVLALTGLAVLLYQVWIHTEHIGKLGWFDRIFSSPSNHRVHHAVNDAYIDKNYGGMLIIWDRLFGTYAEEGEEKCVYGTRPPLESWDPIWANLIVYRNLIRDAWRMKWPDKLRIWFMPPGWKPANFAKRYPALPFDITAIKTFDPPLSKNQLWFGCIQFILLLAASATLLWQMGNLPFRTSAVLVVAISAGLWVTGRNLQGSMSIRRALLVDALLCTAAIL
jgi:alkylglycerol monooxygenase